MIPTSRTMKIQTKIWPRKTKMKTGVQTMIKKIKVPVTMMMTPAGKCAALLSASWMLLSRPGPNTIALFLNNIPIRLSEGLEKEIMMLSANC